MNDLLNSTGEYSGVESTVEMLKVFSELAPKFIGASWWNKLNCGYPAYEERIAAVNKLAV